MPDRPVILAACAIAAASTPDHDTPLPLEAVGALRDVLRMLDAGEITEARALVVEVLTWTGPAPGQRQVVTEAIRLLDESAAELRASKDSFRSHRAKVARETIEAAREKLRGLI